MTKIDISVKEPPKKKKCWQQSLKDFLFMFVQWTWALPVNLVGWIAYIICTKILGLLHHHCSSLSYLVQLLCRLQKEEQCALFKALL